MPQRSEAAKEYRRKHNAWNDARRDRHRLMVAEWKAERGCAKCGETDPRCLELHHRDRKTKHYNISTIYRRKWETIQAELEKCDVLCSNCHQRVEYEGYDKDKVPDHKARKRKLVHDYQAKQGCKYCAENDPIVLMSVYTPESGYHREPITKMVLKGRVIDSIRDALKDTYTVCRNCYAKYENVILPEKVND